MQISIKSILHSSYYIQKPSWCKKQKNPESKVSKKFEIQKSGFFKLKQKQYRIRKNSPWLKYISIYNDKKKEKVNSFKCHVWSAYTYTTTEGKNIHTKHYIIYRNVCTSVMKPFPAKKQPSTTVSPPKKISQNLTQNANFSRI